VIPSVHRALHHCAQRVYCVDLKARRRHPIESHHWRKGEDEQHFADTSENRAR
jgi:hypothetical protein